MKISLPFPDPSLMPNRKNGRHWSATNNIRQYCRFLAKTSVPEMGILPEFVPLTVVFNSPDKRHRDLDNLLAACKSYIDGIADGLQINDKRFRPILIDFGLEYNNTVDFHIGEIKWNSS
jgi:crossover junction endodeoxyribonuclease RusA